MKILFHHRIRSKDGQFVHMEELIGALRRLGHEVFLVGPSAVEREEFGADGGWVTRLKRVLPRFLYESLEFFYSIVDYYRLRIAIQRFRPDCLYERYNLFLPTGVLLKRRFGLPMAVEVNAPILDERRRYGGLSLISLGRWSEQFVWRNADVVLPVTRVLAVRVRKAGVPESKIVVVHNGVNLAHFERAPDAEQAKRALGLYSAIVLGFAGFLREWHGVEQVVDWLASEGKGKPYHLLLVGDGPARAGIERRAAHLGVSQQVTITGVVSRDALPTYLAAFDVALQPAVVPYASPLKLFEYMAMGCAILAPASPNIQEILTDGWDALLVSPGDENGFRKGLQQLCSDPQLRERLGRNARQTIIEKGLTWENNARTVVGLFLDLGVVSSAGLLPSKDLLESALPDSKP